MGLKDRVKRLESISKTYRQYKRERHNIKIFTFNSKVGEDESLANQINDFICAATIENYADKNPSCIWDDTFYSPGFDVIDIKYSTCVDMKGNIHESAMLIYKYITNRD